MYVFLIDISSLSAILLHPRLFCYTKYLKVKKTNVETAFAAPKGSLRKFENYSEIYIQTEIKLHHVLIGLVFEGASAKKKTFPYYLYRAFCSRESHCCI